MPELPEVENTCRHLAEAGLIGAPIVGVNVTWPRTVQAPDLAGFVAGLAGRRVAAINRRGKYILLGLDSGDTFVAHLGMSGGLRVLPADWPLDPMTRHTFTLDDGRQLRFVDYRKFGKLWLLPDPAQAMSNMGPEPLEEGFTPQVLARQLAGRDAPIKALLLEQEVVAGVGNLYADESLYLAGIHPLRPGASLSAEEFGRLREAIVCALSFAVAQYDQSRRLGGLAAPYALSTWTLPRDAAEYCLYCQGPISGIRVRGRSSFFCPNCQK